MHYFQLFLGNFKRIITTAKASVKSQPIIGKSYVLSQMNRIECTFSCVPHILFWHCPSILGRGWLSYFCTLYIYILYRWPKKKGARDFVYQQLFYLFIKFLAFWHERAWISIVKGIFWFFEKKSLFCVRDGNLSLTVFSPKTVLISIKVAFLKKTVNIKTTVTDAK